MTDDIDNLTRDELVARLKQAEAEPAIDPNSLASVFTVHGHEAPAHFVKNVMHPGFKWFGIIVGSFVVLMFLTLLVLGIIGTINDPNFG